ncbi:MAG: PQQ-like beta-propeller repeat protein [Acidobacteria bacterium]|nr:PQQ-like beta-propeller repeat protein [Acidobacteriota bacterium]
MTPLSRRELLSVCAGAALTPLAAGAGKPSDWPQWRGILRDGKSPETGLMSKWPEGGPKQKWEVKDLGAGYGSMSVVGDKIYVQGGVKPRSVVHCVDRNSGKKLWTVPVGAYGDQDRGDGPRGTPTTDGDRLYVLAEDGELVCLKASDGSKVWGKNILKEYNGANPHWLLSESPLVEGNHLIVTPGGNDACIVALDKMSGRTVWSSTGLSDRAGYSSCIAATVGNVRTIMVLTAKAGVGVRASDGKPLWRVESPANRTANVATPVYADNRVFYTSAYGTGASCLELEAANGEVKQKEVYFTREMMNHHGGVILHQGHIYGFSNNILTCLEFKTGNVKWKDRSVGKGCLTYADGHLYALGERYTMGLVQATPDGYVEKSRFNIPDLGLPSWAHPVVAHGTLFIRNQGVLTSYAIG